MLFKKKNYHYFVSGMCCNKPFMTQVLLPNKISSYDDIYVLENACAIKFNVNYDDIVIMNYKLLKHFRY